MTAIARREDGELAEFLVRRVCERAAGRLEPECTRNYPRDVYFAGNLRPLDEEAVDVEFMSKVSPVAFGAEFRLQPEGSEIITDISVSWACYYRVFPTLEQQRDHQRKVSAGEDGPSDVQQPRVAVPDVPRAAIPSSVSAPVPSEAVEMADQEDAPEAAEPDGGVAPEETDSSGSGESASDRRRARTPRDSLFIRYRKIECIATGWARASLAGSVGWGVDTADLKAALEREVLRAQELAMADPERVRTAEEAGGEVRVPENALASERTYNEFLKSLSAEVVPTWRWDVRTEVRSEEGDSRIRVLFEFVNASPAAREPQKKWMPNREPFVFDAEAVFKFRGADVVPFELELAQRSFRYDRFLLGRGFNCGVERTSSNPITFQTMHTPTYLQLRYQTRTTPAAAFADLASNPIPVLRAIANAMEAYDGRWDEAWQQYTGRDPQWVGQFGNEFNQDRERFRAEVRRFARGLKLLEEDGDARLAFQLMNETFQRADPRKTSWRLFQVVFVVSQIPGIVALRDPAGLDVGEREFVDVVYFPTGGGKTEAYLATLVFHCFFDRLRGKAAGVTAWTRFPLRLLTLQQTQRVADVIGTAEVIRRRQVEGRLNGPGVDGFAVGYFVGQEATPNQLSPPGQWSAGDPMWSQANDEVARQRWKRVARCPACRKANVRVDFDRVRVRLLHRCGETTCPFPEGVIPVYVVDNEIYRYLPSVVVGTIDKLAGLGNQRKFALILGNVDGRCGQHGYFKGRCCQKECTDRTRLRRDAPRGISGPTLFVQDELHLLKEGLGTFDAHYETFTQRLREALGQHDTLKVIASSATIEAFERQVEHLYGREPAKARMFPSPGPMLGESFYAETLDDTQRMFVGVMPHNKTIFNAILELIEFYHREVESLWRLPLGTSNPYGGAIEVGSAEWIMLLDRYRTSLSYFLSHRELNSVHTDLEGDVNPRLVREGLSALTIRELTSSTTTDEVARTLELLEGSSAVSATPDAVLATNMVSHGVDIDRFNGMIFYGMPRQTAEYIQASSRVGRVWTGIIFTCFHPVRERDWSHYLYFKKYHEFLGRLVEPVAINRWSRFSVQRTLPGLFMGVLLQVLAHRSSDENPNQYYMLDFVKRKIGEGVVRPEDFVPLLERSYGVEAAGDGVRGAFREDIRRLVRYFFDQIVGAGSGRRYVSEVLIPPPMRSLRDVDEPVEIELDTAGWQWGSGGGR